jgi:hypothetical protein
MVAGFETTVQGFQARLTLTTFRLLKLRRGKGPSMPLGWAITGFCAFRVSWMARGCYAGRALGRCR